MYLAMTLFVIYAVRRWADWKNWKIYHDTMIFFGAINIIYNFMDTSYDRFLWKIDPTFLSYSTEEIIHSFILFPGVALIFLSRKPQSGKKLVIYLIKWILLFFVMEGLLVLTDKIHYAFGWNIWCSLIFVCIMFPCLLVHHSRPLIGYGFFFLITGFGVWLYRFPI